MKIHQRAWGFFKQHKFLTTAGVIFLILAGWYFYRSLNQNQVATRYVLGTVSKDTLVVSVSGTGQVAASSQVDIKAEASGEAISVLAAQGQEVKAGQALLYIDSRDAQKAVRDAQTSLESAQLALEKLLAPVDKLTLMQAEDSVNQAKQAKIDAQADLKSLADDEFNTVSNSFLELPSIMSGLDSILFGKTINSGQWNLDYYADTAKIYDENALLYRTSAYDSYTKARAAYDRNFVDYKAVSRFSPSSVIEVLLDETYETEEFISDAIKNSNNLIQFYQDALTKHSTQNPITISSTHLTSLSSYTGKVNSHLTSLLSLQQKIVSYEKTITDADRTIEEKQLSLEKVQEGAEEIEIKTQKLTIEDKENALMEANENLANCTVRAPFDGVVSAVDVEKGDSISSGATLVTLISKQRLAEVTLNEIDVAKVKVGQKAMLTFDAVEDLSIAGQIAQIDIVGTASQGVVNYTVKVSFDTQDERIKPGMSASASIIIDSRQDVLVVPNSAIKNQGDISYVEVVANSAGLDTTSASGVTLSALPNTQQIEIGLVNDTVTEIVSGLKEGDLIVVQTVTSGASQTQTQQSTGLRIPGIGGGGAFRGN